MDKLKDVDISTVTWKSIKNDGLDLDYAVAIPRTVANALLKELEDSLEYFTGDLSRIK